MCEKLLMAFLAPTNAFRFLSSCLLLGLRQAKTPLCRSGGRSESAGPKGSGST